MNQQLVAQINTILGKPGTIHKSIYVWAGWLFVDLDNNVNPIAATIHGTNGTSQSSYSTEQIAALRALFLSIGITLKP